MWLVEVDLVMGTRMRVGGKMGRKVGGWEVWLGVMVGVRGIMVFRGWSRMRKKRVWVWWPWWVWVWAEKKVDLVSDETGLVGEV